MKDFILSYNPFEPALSATQVATWVKDCRHIAQWYQPFTGTWVLKSEQHLWTLTDSFRGFFPGIPFLLTESGMIGGSQDTKIWEWINTSKLPVLPAPALVPPPLPPLSSN